ncbi:MAG: hypothetical protein ACPGQS_01650 [Bradymonadia bacterium]
MLNRSMLLFVILVSGCIKENESEVDPAYSFDARSNIDQFEPIDVGFNELSDLHPQDITPEVADAAIVSDMDQMSDIDMASSSNDAMAEPDSEFPGTTARSCGNLFEGRMRVDCTLNGDVDATCVFGDHCFCSPAFRCTSEVLYAGTNECDPGGTCVPRLNEDRCGSPDFPFLKVDCGQLGDTEASCVNGLNCRCSEGYRCGQDSPPAAGELCEANQTCIPEDEGREGTRADSCGQARGDFDPTNCGIFGDTNAFCVFGDHCACSDGYVCEQSGLPGECLPTQRCVLAPPNSQP